MTASADNYLADLYRLEELEGWRLLARHLELTEGFSFIVVLAPDDAGVAYLRSRLPDLVGSPEAVRHVSLDPSAEAGSLTEALLKLPPSPDQVRLIWVDANPVEPERIPERDEAWRRALSRLNRYRNTLQTTLHCTLALAGPVSLQTILREEAPDLWSIRSAVFRIEPAGSARGLAGSIGRETAERVDTSGVGLPGDPAETLAEVERIRGKPGREILLAQLLRRAGRQAFRLLQWDLALKCLREAYALEEAHGGDPELRFLISNEIALVFQTLGQWDRALHYSKKALEVANTHFGASHPSTAVALNNLASLLQATNGLAEAEPLMRQALAIHERIYGDDDPKVATSLNNLAQLLHATNRVAEAEPLMRRALAIDERSFGGDSPEVATALNNLALLLQATNRVAEAEPLMRRALDIDERSYGGDHPEVATALDNLALLLEATNRMGEAEPLMRRALAIDEHSYGGNHPKVATDLNNLALLLQVTNRVAEAEPLVRRALAIDESSYGGDHPEVATDLNNLASLLKATNRVTEAEPLMRRALTIHERSYGDNHPKVATDLNNLAQLLQATNRAAEAEPLMRRALAIDEHSYGPHHPEVASDLNNLAHLLSAIGRLAEAEPYLRRSADILVDFGRRNGNEHPGLRRVISNYRGTLKELGRNEAEIQAALDELGVKN